MSADNTQQATAYTNVVNQDSLTSNINTCIFHKEGIIVNILRVISDQHPTQLEKIVEVW